MVLRDDPALEGPRWDGGGTFRERHLVVASSTLRYAQLLPVRHSIMRLADIPHIRKKLNKSGAYIDVRSPTLHVSMLM